jgi:hypothetical protein
MSDHLRNLSMTQVPLGPPPDTGSAGLPGPSEPAILPASQLPWTLMTLQGQWVVLGREHCSLTIAPPPISLEHHELETSSFSHPLLKQVFSFSPGLLICLSDYNTAVLSEGDTHIFLTRFPTNFMKGWFSLEGWWELYPPFHCSQRFFFLSLLASK